MIELEVQILAHTREGLLMDMGRIVSANGFTLQRQRLVMDRHGALLTLIVAGPPRKQRTLTHELGRHERVISLEIAPADGVEMRAHFAASRALDTSGYVLAAPFESAPVASSPEVPAVAVVPMSTTTLAPHASSPERSADDPPLPHEAEAASEVPMGSESPLAPASARRSNRLLGEAWDESDLPAGFLLPPPPPSAPAPAPPPADPFVDIAPLPPDEAAVERLLGDGAELNHELVAVLLQLDRAVAPGAREPSLQRAGQRMGAALARRDITAASMSLVDAIEQVGLPAVRAMVEVDVQGSQLHIRHSPLCAEPGHSGCAFFSGLLEGALGPLVAAREVSVFNVCCRAWGADECVLAIAD